MPLVASFVHETMGLMIGREDGMEDGWEEIDGAEREREAEAETYATNLVRHAFTCAYAEPSTAS